MKRRWVWAIVYVGWTTLLTASQGAISPFPIYGSVDSLSCAKWTVLHTPDLGGQLFGPTFPNADRQLQPARDAQWAWVWGFVTGSGAALAENGVELRQTYSDAITGWVTGYCRSHPEARLDSAAAALVSELRPR